MTISSSKVSSTMFDKSPVFIVGAPRSGTSILYRTLQLHSSFKPQNCKDKSGVELTETNIFKAPFSLYAASNIGALAYMLDDQSFYHQFLDSIQPIQKNQSLIPGRFILYKAIPKIQLFTDSFRTFLWRAIRNDKLVKTYLYYAQQARGAKRLIEKTPQHIALLPEIRATFPDAKLLYMPRHPVDVFSSYRRRLQDSIKLKADPKELKWLDLTPKSFCQRYADSAQIAVQESRTNPKQFMLIRYEDFTSDTRTFLHEILEFLDESYEEQCIPNSNCEKSDWQADPHLFGGIKSKTKIWQDYVEASEARLIENYLEALMSELNYSRYT